MYWPKQMLLLTVRNNLLRCSSKQIYQTASYNLYKFYSVKSVADEYREKLLRRAKAEGFDSIDQLKESLKETIEAKKKEMNKIDPLKELEAYEESYKMAMNQDKVKGGQSKKPIGNDTSPKSETFNTLDSYLKLSKIANLTTQEIEYLWRVRWADKDNFLSAVIPSPVFNRMMTNIKQNRTFVLPLPREVKSEKSKDHGMELHVIQWQFVGPHTTHCIITSLAEYKLHNQYARPHTTIEFHSELDKANGIILMNGNVDLERNISLQDAQLLLLNIQRFYGATDENTSTAKRRRQLLKDFTSGSSNFEVDTLIELAQSMEN